MRLDGDSEGDRRIRYKEPRVRREREERVLNETEEGY